VVRLPIEIRPTATEVPRNIQYFAHHTPQPRDAAHGSGAAPVPGRHALSPSGLLIPEARSIIAIPVKGLEIRVLTIQAAAQLQGDTPHPRQGRHKGQAIDDTEFFRHHTHKLNIDIMDNQEASRNE